LDLLSVRGRISTLAQFASNRTCFKFPHAPDKVLALCCDHIFFSAGSRWRVARYAAASHCDRLDLKQNQTCRKPLLIPTEPKEFSITTQSTGSAPGKRQTRFGGLEMPTIPSLRRNIERVNAAGILRGTCAIHATISHFM
jgi:hypothetical protein